MGNSFKIIIFRNFGFIQIADDRSVNGNHPYVKSFFNNMNKENYFLKAVGKANPKSQRSGDYCIGCSFQAVETESIGYKHSVSASQAYSIGFARTLSPFVLIGLGRTTNYIENFNIGVSKNGKWSKSWSPVIPNSQVFVYPSGNNVDKWTIEAYVNPTLAFRMIIGITVIVVLVMSCIALVLHLREVKEDNEERGNLDFVNI